VDWSKFRSSRASRSARLASVRAPRPGSSTQRTRRSTSPLQSPTRPPPRSPGREEPPPRWREGGRAGRGRRGPCCAWRAPRAPSRRLSRTALRTCGAPIGAVLRAVATTGGRVRPADSDTDRGVHGAPGDVENRLYTEEERREILATNDRLKLSQRACTRAYGGAREVAAIVAHRVGRRNRRVPSTHAGSLAVGGWYAGRQGGLETATWSKAGQLDWWVRERQEWWGRVRGADGRQRWISAVDLCPAKRLTAIIGIHVWDAVGGLCGVTGSDLGYTTMTIRPADHDHPAGETVAMGVDTSSCGRPDPASAGSTCWRSWPSSSS